MFPFRLLSSIFMLLLFSTAAWALPASLLAPAGMAVVVRASSGCLENGDSVLGTLRYVKTKHPNGTPIEVYQLKASGQQCVTGQILQEGKVEAGTFHVVLPEGQNPASLEKYLGKQVVVSGEFMESHTAWHIGDAVILNAKVDAAG